MVVDYRAAVTLAFVRNSVGQIVTKGTLVGSSRDSTVCRVMILKLARCDIPASRTFHEAAASIGKAARDTLNILG